jgi:hypothetical protein
MSLYEIIRPRDAEMQDLLTSCSLRTVVKNDKWYIALKPGWTFDDDAGHPEYACIYDPTTFRRVEICVQRRNGKNYQKIHVLSPFNIVRVRPSRRDGWFTGNWLLAGHENDEPGDSTVLYSAMTRAGIKEFCLKNDIVPGDKSQAAWDKYLIMLDAMSTQSRADS